MKKNFTLPHHTAIRAVILMLLSLAFQVTMAQDFDFEQDVELNVLMEA